VDRFAAARSRHELDELQDQVRTDFGYVFDDFLRNAWIASSFAKARGLEMVRLCPDLWPDFFLLERGLETAYEATEADDPDRLRDAEYAKIQRRQLSGEKVVIPDPESGLLTPERARHWLTRAAERKANKHYHGNASLVIYLTSGEYGIHQDAIEAVMAEATTAACHSFESVWVLWKGVAYPTWPSGVTGLAKRPVEDKNNGRDRA
jgi:hypothetical protein